MDIDLSLLHSGTLPEIDITDVYTIPEEYYEHFYSPNDYTIESLCKLINIVLEKSPKELQEKAINARKFILDNKTSKKQIYKIILFLNTLP